MNAFHFQNLLFQNKLTELVSRENLPGDANEPYERSRVIIRGYWCIMAKSERLDKTIFKRQFQLARKKIYATETVCGICGKPVDFELKFPHPLSPCCDHIIPVNKGGHPYDLENLQLAHLACNRFKSDKIVEQQVFVDLDAQITNRNLPLHCDWTAVNK